MPRQPRMSWEGAPNFRWVKMYKGVRYRVTCEELGSRVRTKEATVSLASAWWQKKVLEVEGSQPRSEEEVAYEELIQAVGESPLLQKATGAITALIPDHRARITDRSVRACGRSFLAVVRGGLKPRSYEELAAYINTLNGVPGLLSGDADVAVIDEALVERVYLDLRNSRPGDGRKKKFWGFFRRFVAYLGEKNLIAPPGNLYSKSFKFRVPTKKIPTYLIEEVRDLLASLKSRLRLYALLALNSGMTQVDMGELKKDMVDLEKGTITRRRVKTGDNANVPTVCYRLWPETLELLKLHQSTHPELFLTNMRGNPLVETRYEGDKVRRLDMVVQQWRRAKVPIPLKAFRTIAATKLEDHEVYGRYVQYFLGHSPKSVKDKHYAAPSGQLFDAALGWLRGQFFT